MACEIDLDSPRWPNLTLLRFLALEAGTKIRRLFEDLHFEIWPDCANSSSTILHSCIARPLTTTFVDFAKSPNMALNPQM
jgi:hypothetical protein